MGKPKTPAIPDPIKTIETEAKYNRVNRYNPFGSSEYSTNPDGTYNLTTSFAPDVQSLFSQAINTAQNPYSIKPGMSLPGLPGQQAQPYDITQQVLSGQYIPSSYGTDNQYTDAAFQAAKSMLDPVYQRQERRLSQDLANKGLPVGGEAYSRAFDEFNTGQNRAYQQAAFQAINAGDQRAANQFNQQLQALNQALGAAQGQQAFQEQGRQFNTNAANQQFQLGESQRQFDTNAQAQQSQMLYNMAAALLGMAPNQNPAQLNVNNAFNAAQQQANINAQAQNQYRANTFATLGKLAGILAAPATGGASLFASGAGASASNPFAGLAGLQ